MQLRGVGVDHVGDLRHVTLLHQHADHVDAALGHAVGEFLDGDGLRNGRLRGSSFSFGSSSAMALHALGAAAERGDRTLAHFVGVERGDDGEAARAASARRGARRLRRGSGTRGAPADAAARTRRLRPLRLRAISGARRGRRGGRGLAVAASSPPNRFLASCSALRLVSSSWRWRSSSSRLRASAASRSARSMRVARCRGRRAPPRRSCALRLRARVASASAWARRVALVLGQRAQHDAGRFGGGAARARALRAGAARAGALARRGVGCAGAGAAAASRLRPRLARPMRRFTFSTTTALVRPWLKLWRTTPGSARGFSVSVLFEATLSFFSPGVLRFAHSDPVPDSHSGCLCRRAVRPRPARIAGPKALDALTAREEALLAGPASRAACITFDRPNAKSNCADENARITGISRASVAVAAPQRRPACAPRRASHRRHAAAPTHRPAGERRLDLGEAGHDLAGLVGDRQRIERRALQQPLDRGPARSGAGADVALEARARKTLRATASSTPSRSP